jgi:hypothetical protein
MENPNDSLSSEKELPLEFQVDSPWPESGFVPLLWRFDLNRNEITVLDGEHVVDHAPGIATVLWISTNCFAIAIGMLKIEWAGARPSIRISERTSVRSIRKDIFEDRNHGRATAIHG